MWHFSVASSSELLISIAKIPSCFKRLGSSIIQTIVYSDLLVYRPKCVTGDSTYTADLRVVLICFIFPRMMHDEVSDTENIRKNLAIERMIVEGCDILLDTSQTFVRQGEPHRLSQGLIAPFNSVLPALAC